MLEQRNPERSEIAAIHSRNDPLGMQTLSRLTWNRQNPAQLHPAPGSGIKLSQQGQISQKSGRVNHSRRIECSLEYIHAVTISADKP